MNEKKRNQETADRILQNRQWNGRQFSVGDCVALLDGEIVAVAKSFDDALKQLRSADSDPGRGMLVEVKPAVLDVILRAVDALLWQRSSRR